MEKEVAITQSLGENIKFLLELTGTSLSKLHQHTNVALSNIKRMKHDPTCNPTINSLVPIAEYFSISINQLIGTDPLPSFNSNSWEERKKTNWTNVPLLNWHEAHLWPKLDYSQYETVATDAEVSLHSFALIVHTHEWEGFQEGSYLIFDPKRKPFHSNYTLLHKQGQPHASLKQFLEDEGAAFVKPVDPRFPAIPFSTHFEQIGVLAQIKVDF